MSRIFFGANAAPSEITGTLAVTDTPDVVAANATVSWQATLAATGTPDTAAVAASVKWNATLAATGAVDVLDATATVAWSATLATTDTPDTAAIAANSTHITALAATGTPDTAVISVTARHLAALAVTETTDVLAAAATASQIAALAVTETPDILAASAQVLISGSMAATGSQDVLAATATVSWNITLAATETIDTAAIAVTSRHLATLASIEAPDVLTATASVAWSAALATTEAPDTLAASAQVLVSGTLAATGTPDDLDATGSVYWNAQLAASEEDSWFPVGKTFDGVNDKLHRTTLLTGAVVGPQGGISFWIRPRGNGTTRRIYRLTSNKVLIQLRTDNKIGVFLASSSGSLTFEFTSASTYLEGDGWVWVGIRWNTGFSAGNKIAQLWTWTEANGEINDLDLSSIIDADVTFNVDYNEVDAVISGGSDNNINRYNGDMAEPYVNYTTLMPDLSTEAGRRKFITADGQPAFLGPNGALPTGTSPIIYLRAPDFTTNLGSGGNLALTGSLGDTGQVGILPFPPRGIDVVAATATVSWVVTLAATGTPDTASIATTVSHVGTLITTESLDIVAATATVAWSVTLAAVGTPDTLTASVQVLIEGDLDATENQDIASFTQAAIAATANLIETTDTLAATATIIGTGTLGATESADTAAINVTSRWLATFAASENADSLAAVATVLTAGNIAVIEAPDVLAAEASIVILSASLDALESTDTAQIDAISRWLAILDVTENTDTAHITDVVLLTEMDMAASEAPDRTYMVARGPAGSYTMYRARETTKEHLIGRVVRSPGRMSHLLSRRR